MQIDVHFVRMMLQYGKQLLKIYLFVYVLQWAHHYRRKPAKVMAVTARSIVDIVVADANKPIVLEHRHTIDDLVTGLLLDEANPRRGQQDCDKLQAACASALESLALSDVGKETLRSRYDVIKTLQRVAEEEGLSEKACQHVRFPLCSS